MPKRRWAAGLILIPVLLCLAVGWPWRSEPINPAGYGRLRLGMTPGEVEGAIGLSPGDYYTRHRRLGGPLSGPFVEPLRGVGIPLKHMVDYGPPTQEPHSVTVERWTGNSYCIWVAYDETGTLVGAYILRTWSPDDSAHTALLDQIRSYLGL
jgi:hypothetical protein